MRELGVWPSVLPDAKWEGEEGGCRYRRTEYPCEGEETVARSRQMMVEKVRFEGPHWEIQKGRALLSSDDRVTVSCPTQQVQLT